jgi:hypothetical protein
LTYLYNNIKLFKSLYSLFNYFFFFKNLHNVLNYIFQTKNHNWAIYVNPVGVDASIKMKTTRCVAAGYRWNPYLSQLSDPLNVIIIT